MKVYVRTATSFIPVPDSRDMVVAVLKADGELLEHVDERWCTDEEVVLTAVKHCGRALRFARLISKLNFEIVLTAVEQDGTALQFASEKLRQNRNIVLAAVSQDGCSLRFAMMQDREIVLSAVRQNVWALQFA